MKNIKIVRFDVYLKFNEINDDNQFSYHNQKFGLNLENKKGDKISPKYLPLIPKDYFLVIEGYGAGHGVGLSQWGAKAMAEKGASFRKILKHYYRGVQIKTY